MSPKSHDRKTYGAQLKRNPVLRRGASEEGSSGETSESPCSLPGVYVWSLR